MGNDRLPFGARRTTMRGRSHATTVPQLVAATALLQRLTSSRRFLAGTADTLITYHTAHR